MSDPLHDDWLERIKKYGSYNQDDFDDLNFMHPQLKQEADFWISPPERGDSVEPPSPWEKS